MSRNNCPTFFFFQTTSQKRLKKKFFLILKFFENVDFDNFKISANWLLFSLKMDGIFEIFVLKLLFIPHRPCSSVEQNTKYLTRLILVLTHSCRYRNKWWKIVYFPEMRFLFVFSVILFVLSGYVRELNNLKNRKKYSLCKLCYE